MMVHLALYKADLFLSSETILSIASQDRYLGEESWTCVSVAITSAQTNLLMRQPGTDGQGPRASQTVED